MLRNGERFITFLKENNLVHINGACRQPGDWETRISRGLWTRHAHDHSSTSVLDYSVISAEHVDDLLSMEVDEGGELAGRADHNFVTTSFKDRVVIRSKVERSKDKMGWDIDIEDQDWTAYKEAVTARLDSGAGVSQGAVEDLSNVITDAMLSGLEKGIGRRKLLRPEGKRRLPKDIVHLVFERRKLEKRWKKEKVKFANSRCSVPKNSLIVAAQELQEMRDRVEEEISRFHRQRRGTLLKECRKRTRRGRKTFWRHVTRKEKSTEEISSLQRKDTGAG